MHLHKSKKGNLPVKVKKPEIIPFQSAIFLPGIRQKGIYNVLRGLNLIEPGFVPLKRITINQNIKSR